MAWKRFQGNKVVTSVPCKPQASESQLLEKDYEELGWLGPIGKRLNMLSNGWALSYANTFPFTEKHPFGFAFLATNIIYAVVGYAMFVHGNTGKSLILDAAGVASIAYHWRQIHLGPNRNEVRYALMIDYFTAVMAIGSVIFDICSGAVSGNLSLKALCLGVVAFLNLFGSWYYANGMPYLFFHGLWHVFSGWCAAEVTGISVF